jgi:Protein of unknown function (DUF3303)
MKFMLTWRLHLEKGRMSFFSQMTAADDKADLGDNIRLIGRWHDVSGGTGVAIFESDDAVAISNWALRGIRVLDATVTPVLDDEETRNWVRAGNKSACY